MLSRIHLRNDDINCLCLVYNAATGAKIILTWNMQFNYPWMNLACVGMRAHGATQPLISVSTRSVTGPRPSKRTTEQIQCHTDCVCVCVTDVGKLVSDICNQLHESISRCAEEIIWILQQRKKKNLYFFPEKCASHRTATLQTHDNLTE